VRGIKIQLSTLYSFIFKRKEKKKIEEENYLTPLHPILSPAWVEDLKQPYYSV